MPDFRPLSPHITVHKWLLSQIMPILHRATAIGISFGILFICLWLLSIGLGTKYYSIFVLIFFNLFGKIIITVICFCFFFHFIDELRKIFWAFGIGLDIKSLKSTSYFILSLSILITFTFFIYLL